MTSKQIRRKKRMIKKLKRRVKIIIYTLFLIIIFGNNLFPLEISVNASFDDKNKSSDELFTSHIAGITPELISEYINKIEEKEKYQQYIDMRKAERREEEEIEYKKSHPHYEIYDPSDDRWYHMEYSLQDYLMDISYEAGIDNYFKLLLTQLYVESNYNSNLISLTGDYGIAQINYCNHENLQESLGITDFLDPYQSLKCNVYFMGEYLKEYGISQALSKYNTGQPYDITPYSEKILKIYNNGYGVRLIE